MKKVTRKIGEGCSMFIHERIKTKRNSHPRKGALTFRWSESMSIAAFIFNDRSVYKLQMITNCTYHRTIHWKPIITLFQFIESFPFHIGEMKALSGSHLIKGIGSS